MRSIVPLVLRLIIVVSVAAGIRVAAIRPAETVAVSNVPKLSTVQTLLPQSASIGEVRGDGLFEVRNADGKVLGLVGTTLPGTRRIVGYRGVSHILLAFDQDGVVTGVKLLDSEDTPEHVAAVRESATFFQQFEGWQLGHADGIRHVDAVSGATLTSLAIAESISVRLGDSKPSLRFPDQLTEDDLKLVLPETSGLQLYDVSAYEALVQDQQGRLAGRLIRTGPLSDQITGYQGPSEAVILLDAEGRTSQIALRRTYDNLPYTDYLNEEPYFWKVFLNKDWADVSQIDLVNEQVEGVSGATMTSMAMAKTLLAASEKYQTLREEDAAAKESSKPGIRWTASDRGTVAVLAMALVIGLTPLRGYRSFAFLWKVMLIVSFGLTTGNLLSLALLFGWSAGGVAWSMAPGLVAVIMFSLVAPPLTRRNLYCSHVCPHGAAQQLVRGLLPRPQGRYRRVVNRLRWFPGAFLVVAVAATVCGIQWNAAAWEPFDAYIWRVAPVASIAIAVVSLLVSTFEPMAYCRYGCGTGRLLDYLRRHGHSNRLISADVIAFLLMVFCWVWVWWRP